MDSTVSQTYYTEQGRTPPFEFRLSDTGSIGDAKYTSFEVTGGDYSGGESSSTVGTLLLTSPNNRLSSTTNSKTSTSSGSRGSSLLFNSPNHYKSIALVLSAAESESSQTPSRQADTEFSYDNADSVAGGAALYIDGMNYSNETSLMGLDTQGRNAVENINQLAEDEVEMLDLTNSRKAKHLKIIKMAVKARMASNEDDILTFNAVSPPTRSGRKLDDKRTGG